MKGGDGFVPGLFDGKQPIVLRQAGVLFRVAWKGAGLRESEDFMKE